MNENSITGVVIAGDIYDVIDNGVNCNQCAVKDLCLEGKLGSKVQFDCASVHLEKSKLIMNKDKTRVPDPPSMIILSDDVLDDIYSDMQADQAIMLEQSGIYE